MNTDKEIRSIGRDGRLSQSSIKRKKTKTDDRSSISYLNIGFYLITPILVGVFLGSVVDSYFHTRPIFIILFLIVGTIMCFYNLFKVTQDASH